MVRALAIGAILGLLLVGCSEKRDRKAVAKVELTPEQRACFDRVNDLKTAHITNMVKITAEAMMARQSTTGLKIEERRMNEKICMAEVACYGSQEPLATDIQFESCLDGLEHSDG